MTTMAFGLGKPSPGQQSTQITEKGSFSQFLHINMHFILDREMDFYFVPRQDGVIESGDGAGQLSYSFDRKRAYSTCRRCNSLASHIALPVNVRR